MPGGRSEWPGAAVRPGPHRALPGDRQLHAWVLAREAMVPINWGAPQAAVRLAEQARQIAGPRPTAAATLAAAVAARVYALAHQPEQARAALADADNLMAQLDTADRADTWLTHGEQKHHVHLSYALTALGDTHRAHDSQQRALELSTPTSTMTRSLPAVDAATCAHRGGDTETACRRATVVLCGLPADYRTGLVHRRAAELYRAVPAQYRALGVHRERLHFGALHRMRDADAGRPACGGVSRRLPRSSGPGSRRRRAG
ncbi:hypothetical protein ACFZC3_06440 [Streptomyces sp. NPDC007903]|uniref:hypothetical protein n=1 Tax=Streptomyces sp. NPDC007903 TaxID=3364786 RepID=UPI0036E5FC70